MGQNCGRCGKFVGWHDSDFNESGEALGKECPYCDAVVEAPETLEVSGVTLSLDEPLSGSRAIARDSDGEPFVVYFDDGRSFTYHYKNGEPALITDMERKVVFQRGE